MKGELYEKNNCFCMRVVFAYVRYGLLRRNNRNEYFPVSVFGGNEESAEDI